MTLAQKLYEQACVQTFAPMLPWERLDPAHQVTWEAIAETATAHLTGSDAATSAARIEELLDVIARLIACRKGIEYSTREEQAALREARAVLAEAGR